MENLDQYVQAYEASFPYARDNHGVLTAYARQLVDACLKFSGSIDLCSLGIGYEIVSRSLATQIGEKIQTYTAVEGSALLIQRYRQRSDFPYKLNLVHDYFETFETDQRFDVIEMGFVLEHVDDPALIVERFSRMLKPAGVICAAVPNALSLHRLLGARAGLLKDPYALSEWDLQLGHKRYFDRDSFIDLFRQCNLRITKEAGLMLKPFSTAQLNALDLPDSVWEVLFHSGDLAPAYAYGLYVEVRLPERLHG
jgi:2-polyprenyl-3-methyl-5-hydroxy-6-metoxy-1,4-benzoquinol methylase